MRIAVFDIENWERERFTDLESEHEITYVKESISAKNADDHADAKAISTFIYSTIDGEVLSKLPNLKLIATRSTGVDHIDVDTCRERDITICNVPTYGSNTVAEHVFGLLLTISHRLEEAIDRTRKGQFSPRGLQGFDLEGKTLGVVGTGDIGRHVIRIANGFGMKVLAFDVKPDEQAARELGFEYVEMDELLSGSDIVTLHVPASPKTENMVSDEQFRKMKKGAVLINTARGKVVNTKALVRALAEGKLAGAGLDVLPMEPVIREEAELLRSVYEEAHDLSSLLADEVIARMRNVVVTPHSAFNTREAVQRILDTTVDNIRAYAKGHAKNVVGGPAPAEPTHR
jgi:D-lactate dehydrogenase